MRHLEREAFVGVALRLAGRAAGNASLLAMRSDLERLLELYASAAKHEINNGAPSVAQAPTVSPDVAAARHLPKHPATGAGKSRRTASVPKSRAHRKAQEPDFQPWIAPERVQ